MANLSVRSILSKCRKKSGKISLLEDIYSINGIPSPKSLKSALTFIRDFKCPPAAPTNLSISRVSINSISITWDDKADNEDGFEIVWKAQFIHSGSNKIGSNRRDFTATNLKSGLKYCIKVRAFNKGGNSDFSNEVCATTPERQETEKAYSKVFFFNCHKDKVPVKIERIDLKTYTIEVIGTIEYQGSGTTCPAGGISPLAVSFPKKGHEYHIIGRTQDGTAINMGYFLGDPNSLPYPKIETIAGDSN